MCVNIIIDCRQTNTLNRRLYHFFFGREAQMVFEYGPMSTALKDGWVADARGFIRRGLTAVVLL